MKYLTEQEILRINFYVIRIFGKSFEQAGRILNKAGFFYLSELQFLEKFITEKYVGRDYKHVVAEVMAHYFFKIIKNHIFLNGNKRTALICSVLFAKRNGFQLDNSITPIEFEQLALNVECNVLSFKALVDWFLTRLKITGCGRS